MRICDQSAHSGGAAVSRPAARPQDTDRPIPQGQNPESLWKNVLERLMLALMHALGPWTT